MSPTSRIKTRGGRICNLQSCRSRREPNRVGIRESDEGRLTPSCSCFVSVSLTRTKSKGMESKQGLVREV